MKRHLSIPTCFALTALFFALPAFAVPSEITYMGRLVGATGKPVEGTVALTAGFYRASEGGDPLTDKTFDQSVKLVNGLFTISIELTDDERATIFSGEEVFIEVTDTTNDKAYARQKYSATPYAFRVPTDDTTVTWNGDGKLAVGVVPALKLKVTDDASVALKAATDSDEDLSFTLPSSVTPGAYMTTDANGNLSWNTPSGAGDVTGITIGTGLTGGGTAGDIPLGVDVGTAANKIVQLTGAAALPAVSGTNLTNLDADDLAAGTIPNARFPATMPAASGANLTALNATNLSSGTIPNARFPATLPAASGANLTSLNAAELTGSLPAISFPATLPAASGINLTSLNADELSSGTLPNATFPTVLPAVNGSALTALNANNLGSGTLPDARFPAVLPAASGANLTNLDASDLTGAFPALDGSNISDLNAANLSSGTIPSARFPAALPALNGNALTSLAAGNLTGTLPALNGNALTNLDAANLTGTLPALNGSTLTNLSAANLTGALPAVDGSALTNLTAGNLAGALPAVSGAALTGLSAANLSGTLPDPTFPATLPAASGVNLTDLNATNIASGNIALARLPSGTNGDVLVHSGGAWTKLAAGTPGQSLTVQSTGIPAWDTPTALYTKREMGVLKNPGAATATTYGLAAAPTLTATATTSDDSSGPLVNHATTAVANNPSGVISLFTVFRGDWDIEYATTIKTDAAAITTSRIWVGLMSASLDAVASPTTQHVAAFRYDTGVDGTAFWRTVTNDGAATENAVTTTTAIAANTAYRLRIVGSASGTNYKFYINDVLVSTHTTDLPGATTLLGYGNRIITLAASARNLKWGRINILHK